jgi:multidrug efflux pump subunit AcrA (membrane-fusion protein)
MGATGEEPVQGSIGSLILQLRRDAARRRNRGFSAGVALACSVLLVGCNSSNDYVPPPPPKVVVAQPLEKPVTTYLELTGNTAPVNSVDLVARVQGYLQSIDYKDGASI